MPRAQWQLKNDSPVIEVLLVSMISGATMPRLLLADTAAGNLQSSFELLHDVNHCKFSGAKPSQVVTLGGAYTVLFPLYLVPIEIPSLGFKSDVAAVGYPCRRWVIKESPASAS